MKSKFTLFKKICIVSTGLTLGLSLQSAKAQLLPVNSPAGNSESFFKASLEDAEKLFKAYANPYIKGLGSSLNAGWANTAKTHTFLNKVGFPIGFNITINANASIVPTVDRTFDIKNLGLKSFSPSDPNNTIAPTLAGKDKTGPELKDNSTGTVRFNTPNGSGYPIIGLPIVQLGVGFIKSTDVMVRFVPKISIGDVDVQMLGFGLKHDVKQWIPGISALPFDLSVLFGYTNLKSQYYLNKNDRPDQYMDMDITAFTYGAIVSKKIALLTLYGGLGYDASSTNFKVKGTYVNTSSAKIVDPIDTKFDGANSFKANAGFRLKFAVITFHADYTLAKYQSISAGLGFSIGE